MKSLLLIALMSASASFGQTPVLSSEILVQDCRTELSTIGLPEVEIRFSFRSNPEGKQIAEVQVFRGGNLSASEGESFSELLMVKNFPDEGQFKLATPDGRLQFHNQEIRHPQTGQLQLPENTYIRWRTPLTMPLENVVHAVCPLWQMK